MDGDLRGTTQPETSIPYFEGKGNPVKHILDAPLKQVLAQNREEARDLASKLPSELAEEAEGNERGHTSFS